MISHCVVLSFHTVTFLFSRNACYSAYQMNLNMTAKMQELIQDLVTVNALLDILDTDVIKVIRIF